MINQKIAQAAKVYEAPHKGSLVVNGWAYYDYYEIKIASNRKVNDGAIADLPPLSLVEESALHASQLEVERMREEIAEDKAFISNTQKYVQSLELRLKNYEEHMAQSSKAENEST